MTGNGGDHPGQPRRIEATVGTGLGTDTDHERRPGEGRRPGLLGAFDAITRRMQSAGPRIVLGALVAGLVVFLSVAGVGLLLRWAVARLAPLVRGPRERAIPVQTKLSPERRSQVRFYARLLDELRARGLGKPQWRPPLAHAATIQGVDAGAADRAAGLVHLYYAATFGDRALSAAELARADALLTELTARKA